ncbi:hypothetical protein SUGI_0309120 [Cryptomeria japonica]|nr:hypothetical protein SUGI_0309120 [Cryptomeria japonica]
MVTSNTRSSNGNAEDLVYRFNDFKPFRYVVAADVLGCFYSLIHIIRLLCISTGTGGLGLYLNFISDQVLTFIVLSSASAGIGCVMLTEEFIKAADSYDSAAKKFLRFASASVSMQFLGFVIIAFCAVVSGYSLSCYMYSSYFDFVQRRGIPATYVDTERQDDTRNRVSEL